MEYEYLWVLCLLIAYSYLGVFILVLIGLIYLAFRKRKKRVEKNPYLKVAAERSKLVMMYFAIACLFLICTAVLIYGLHTHKPIFMLPWICFQAFHVVAMAVGFMCGLYAIFHHQVVSPLCILLIILFILLQIWNLLLIVLYYLRSD